MALLQKVRLLANERLDLPDFQNLEDFVCADFKALHRYLWTNQNHVFAGFAASGVGTNTLSVAVADAALINGANNGTVFLGAPSLDPLTTTNLAISSTNFIEVTITEDTGGEDSRAFWDTTAAGGAGAEFSQIIDTFIFTKSELVINTAGFSGGADKVKICEVDVNGSGIITAIRDSRDMFFRLGRAGTPAFNFPWASRVEPANTSFSGADKDIGNWKEMIDAMMTEFKQLKGTTYWFEDYTQSYTSTSIIALGDKYNVAISKLDAAVGAFAGASNDQDRSLKLVRGGVFSWDSGTGVLSWTSDAFFQVIGLTEARNKVAAGSVTLSADGAVAYVNINRAGAAPATLTVVASTISGMPASGPSLVIFARRLGSDVLVGNSTFLLKDKQSAYNDGAVDEINQLTNLGIVVATNPASVSANVTPATGTRADGSNIRIPLGTQIVTYAGGTINFSTGVVTGGGQNFTGATSLLAASQDVYYSVQIIQGNPNQILVIPGTPAATGTATYAPFQSGAIPRAQVLVKKNGSSVVQVVPQTDVTMVLSAGSGGGDSGVGADLLKAVVDNEAGMFNTPQSKLILDDYNQARGTLTNLSVQNSNITLSGANLSGNQVRSLETGTVCSNVNGVLLVKLRAMAPKNTAIASNQIKFTGDVTAYFPTSSPVVLMKEIDSDGKKRHIYLMDTFNNVAKLLVSSVSYSGGPNETTLTLSNPSALDLSMGISTPNLHTQLRIAPADINLQAASDGSTYEDLVLSEAHITSVVGFQGNGQEFTLPGSINGTIDWSDMQLSDNGQYAVVTALERSGGNSTWHFWYSNSGGAAGTFVKFAGTKTANDAITREHSGTYSRSNRMQMRIADNGKMIASYYRVQGSNHSLRAVYANLTDVTPAVADMPQVGSSDAVNDLPTTDGVIFALSGTNLYGTAELDKSNASMVVFTGGAPTSNLYARFYTWTGATPVHVGLSNAMGACLDAGSSLWGTEVTGTSPNHRITVFRSKSPSGNFAAHYWDEGSTTEVGNSTITTSDNRLMDCRAVGNKVYLMFQQNTPLTGAVTFLSGDLSTQIYSSEHSFDSAQFPTVDTYNGFGVAPGDLGGNQIRTGRQKLAIDPSNTNHILMVADQRDPITTSCKTRLYEVTDATDFLGTFINAAPNATNNFRDNSARQEWAQTITGTVGQRIRTFKMRAYQVGTLPSNATLYMEVQGVSSGAPNGVVLATSQSIDASKITKNSSSVFLYFNFPSLALANQQYALVIKSTNIATSASNYLTFSTNSGDVYAGGELLFYNGSTWSSAGVDMAFELMGEYVSTIGDGLDITTSFVNAPIENQEASIAISSSSTAQILYRSAFYNGTAPDVKLYNSGHTTRRVLSLSTGNAQSSIGAVGYLGFAAGNLDPNLILSVDMGNAACEGKVLTTGLGDGIKASDRSGVSHTYGVIGTVAGDFIADLDFESGTALQIATTGSRIEYENNGSIGNIEARQFVVEVEYKPNTLAADNYMVSKHSSGNSNGWLTLITTSGTLLTSMPSGGGTTESIETFAAGVYHKFKVTGNGSVVRMYYWNGSSYTEVTYASQATSYNVVTNAYPISVGVVLGGSGAANGRIGRVKLSMGTQTFTYEGFKNQASFGSTKNVGPRALALKHIGFFDDSGINSQTFDELRLIETTVETDPLVDTFVDQWLMKKTLLNSGKLLTSKLLMARGTTLNTAAVEALGVQFGK